MAILYWVWYTILGGKVSQRHIGYNGGIKTGTIAGDSISKYLEASVRNASIDNLRTVPTFRWVSGISASSLGEQWGYTQETRACGVYPDGGIWIDSAGKPVLAVEAKKQGKLGNAIERWFKNASILLELGVEKYITFCCDEGFYDNNSAMRTLQTFSMSRRQNMKYMWDSLENQYCFYRYRTIQEILEPEKTPSLVLYKALCSLGGTPPGMGTYA